MVGVELHRLLLALKEGLERGGCHGAEPLADEAVEEEVDGCVEKGQHVGNIGHDVHQPAVLDGCPVEVIEDHDDARGPEGGKDGGNGEQDGGGFPCRVATEAEIALPPEFVHDDGVQDEEDGAGHQVDGEAVNPDEHVMQGSADVVFGPDVGPPVVGNAGQEAGGVDADDDFPSAGWVGDSVILEGVTHSDVAVNG